MPTVTLDAPTLKTALTHVLKTGAGKNGLPAPERKVRLHGPWDDLRLTSHLRGYQLTAILPPTNEDNPPIDAQLHIDHLKAALDGSMAGKRVEIDAVNDEAVITVGRRAITRRNYDEPLETIDDVPVMNVAVLNDDHWRKVVEAAATDDSRPVLAGVHVTVTDRLVMTAADGFRMGYYTTPRLDLAFEDGDGVVIPATAFRHVPKNTYLAICQTHDDGKYAVLEYAIPKVIKVIAVVETIDGAFPDLAQIIPEYDRTVELQAEDVIEAGKFAKKHGKNSVVKIEADGIKVATQDGHAAWNGYELDITDEYAYQGEYLEWMASGAEIMELSLGDPNQAGRVDRGPLTMVTMPMVTGAH